MGIWRFFGGCAGGDRWILMVEIGWFFGAPGGVFEENILQTLSVDFAVSV